MIVNVIKASSTPPTGGSRGLWTSSQNDFLSDFNKCVITGSDTAKSCQIIYVTELSLPLHGIIPGYYLTQENDALKKKMSGDLVHGRRRRRRRRKGGEGAACKSITAASLYHSLSVNTKKRKKKPSWPFSKMEISPACRLQLHIFVRLAKWHILRVGCFGADTRTQYAVA